MTSILLKLVAFIIALWILRRFLGSIFGEPRRQVHSRSQPVKKESMVKDPVCGMYMDPRLAVSLNRRGASVYFCSDECRRKFADQPRGSGPEIPC
jgi:YHS domain-containing protein